MYKDCQYVYITETTNNNYSLKLKVYVKQFYNYEKRRKKKVCEIKH